MKKISTFIKILWNKLINLKKYIMPGWENRKTITRVGYIIGAFLLLYILIAGYIIAIDKDTDKVASFKELIFPVFTYVMTSLFSFIMGFLIKRDD